MNFLPIIFSKAQAFHNFQSWHFWKMTESSQAAYPQFNCIKLQFDIIEQILFFWNYFSICRFNKFVSKCHFF